MARGICWMSQIRAWWSSARQRGDLIYWSMDLSFFFLKEENNATGPNLVKNYLSPCVLTQKDIKLLSEKRGNTKQVYQCFVLQNYYNVQRKWLVRIVFFFFPNFVHIALCIFAFKANIWCDPAAVRDPEDGLSKLPLSLNVCHLLNDSLFL